MTTISELQQLAVDLEYRVQQERQANIDDLSALRNHLTAVRTQVESTMSNLNALNDAIEKMFADRSDALAATIGTPPSTQANG